MSKSLRDKILAAKDIESKQVEVPQWGVTVEVRGLSGRQRAHLLKDAVDSRGRVDYEKIYPEVIVAGTYDPETGDRLFRDGDQAAVAEKSGAALDLLAGAVLELSGLDAKAAEKATKN